MNLKIDTEINHVVLISNFKSKLRLKYLLIVKNGTLVLFYAVLVDPLSTKGMATRKGPLIFCKFQNLANTYLRKVTKFQGYGFCRFGVPMH